MNKKYFKLEHATSERSQWFVVNWCLGNTCNYACSYCPENLHNGSLSWPDLSTIKNFISNVVEQISPRKAYFEFTGGEVTLYKNFVEVCKHCTDLGAKVGLISNASRTVRWWKENSKYFDHVCLSYHPEFSDVEHFIKVVETVKDDIRTHVNIMMLPEKFDFCFAVANRIKDLGNISMALQPLIVDFGDTLFNYTDDQKEVFSKQYDLIIKHIKFTKQFNLYRGAMKMVHEDGTTTTSSAHRFISEKTNNWHGWKCYAGVEQVVVDLDGHVYRGWCKVGNRIGSLLDKKLNLPTSPVTCDKTMCHCNFDIMSTKHLYE